MYDTILIPTDGSDQAARAARHGLALARAFDATVHVLSATDVARAAGPFDAGGVDESFRARLEAEADDAIAAVESVAGDVSLETTVAEGEPGDAIVEYVADRGVDLVVMGTHGRRGVRRFVVGSVAEHVVRHSPVPVVTARNPAESGTDADATPTYDRILVPTDGSDPATLAVEHAVAVADAVDATIHALGVVDLGAIAAGSGVMVTDELRDSLLDRAENAVATVEKQASDADVEVVTAVHEGYPAGAVLDYVDSEEVDLVAMGTHGRSGISRFLLGSTAERVVRRADVPVLTVRPEN